MQKSATQFILAATLLFIQTSSLKMHAIGAKPHTPEPTSLGQVENMENIYGGVDANRYGKKCSDNFKYQPQIGHVQSPHLKIGAALGGGGCLSVISQLGFLRGLLVDTGDAYDKDDLTIANLGSSSGGSWALAMFLNGQTKDSGVWYDHLRGTTHQFKDLASDEWGQNALGRYCMTGLLNNKTRDYHNYSDAFTMCGSCASSRRWSYAKASCTADESKHLFGLAQRCLSASDTFSQAESGALNGDVEKTQKGGAALGDAMMKTLTQGLFASSHGIEALFKNLMAHFKSIAEGKTQWYELPLDKGLINPLLTGDDTSPQFIGYKETLYQTFFVEDMERETTLAQISTSLSHKDFGEVGWGVFFTEFNRLGTGGKWSPLQAMSDQGERQICPDSSGMSLRSNMTVMDAITRTGDAMAGLASSIVLQSWMAAYCENVTERVKTRPNDFPYPFTNVGGGTSFAQSMEGAEDTESANEKKHKVGTDGFMVDNNAISQTLKMMENVDDDTRPQNLIALVSGQMNNDPTNLLGNPTEISDVDQIFNYFQEWIHYKDLFLFRWGFGAIRSRCVQELLDMFVKNPIHLFTKKWGMQDAEVYRKFKMESKATGLIFVKDVDVNPNDYFGIKGAWKNQITLVFSVLSKTDNTGLWIEMVYGSDQKKRDRDYLKKNFPFQRGGLIGNIDILVPTGAGGLSSFHGFALMNYNSWKGYIIQCALMKHRKGSSCVFCKKYPDVCKEGFPGIPF